MTTRILIFLLVTILRDNYNDDGLLVEGLASSMLELEWQQRSSYASTADNIFSSNSQTLLGRHHPIVFANETHGFVLGGTTIAGAGAGTGANADDFFVYEEATDSWTSLPVNEQFTPRSFGYGVVLNELNNPKAYLGFGAALATGERLNDFWEFDMITLQWKELKPCPGLGRRHPSVVPVYDGSTSAWQIHVGLGDGYFDGRFTNLNDYWSYDITTNMWTQLPDFPSSRRHHPFFFGLHGESYVGLGHSDRVPYIERDFFSYSTNTSTWSKQPDFESYSITNSNPSGNEKTPTLVSTEARVAGTEFSIVLPLVGGNINKNANTDNSEVELRGSIGFVLSGDGDDHKSMREGEFHAFYPSPLGNNITWRKLASHPGASRWAPGSFVIRGTARAYFTSGYDRSTQLLHSDVWMMDLSPLFMEQKQQLHQQQELKNDTNTTTNNNHEGSTTGNIMYKDEAVGNAVEGEISKPPLILTIVNKEDDTSLVNLVGEDDEEETNLEATTVTVSADVFDYSTLESGCYYRRTWALMALTNILVFALVAT